MLETGLRMGAGRRRRGVIAIAARRSESMRWEFARTATFRMRSPKLRLSLAAQLVAAFGISVLVTLLLAAAAVWGSNRIEATTRLLKSSEHQLRALEQLATKLQKRHTAWTRFVYAGR